MHQSATTACQKCRRTSSFLYGLETVRQNDMSQSNRNLPAALRGTSIMYNMRPARNMNAVEHMTHLSSRLSPIVACHWETNKCRLQSTGEKAQVIGHRRRCTRHRPGCWPAGNRCPRCRTPCRCLPCHRCRTWNRLNNWVPGQGGGG